MVDLGQKKVNTRLPFFMRQTFWGGEPQIASIEIKFPCEPFLFRVYSFTFVIFLEMPLTRVSPLNVHRKFNFTP